MTDNQDKRKILLAGLTDFLKKNGFKKKAFTYRRETEKGLIQIIELSLGQSWSIKSGEINLEFGIFSDEWHKFLNRWKMPATLRTTDCEIRDCYCKIVDLGKNHNWYKLSNDLNELILELISVINKDIFPFFDQHKTRKEILESYSNVGEGIGLPPRHKLSIAVLNYGAGNLDDAQSQLNEEYKENEKNSFYQEVYKNLKTEIEKTKAQQQV